MGSDGPPTPSRRVAERLTAWTHASSPDAARFIADEREGHGVLRNVSTTGALLEDVSRQVDVGVVVDLFFLLGRGRKQRIRATGKVVRQTGSGFAVSFLRVERELERLVLGERPRPGWADAEPEPAAAPAAADAEDEDDAVIDLIDVAEPDAETPPPEPAAPPSPSLPETVLRARYERLRALPPGQQIQDCVEYIGNPEVLVFEFVESFAAIEASCAQHDFSLRAPPAEDGEIVLGHFHEGLELAVEGADGYAFRCVATNLSPLGRSPGEEPDDPSGLDYLGLVHGPRGGLALGVAPWLLEFTPYSLLMRALNCLAELAPASQIERLNRDFLEGALEGMPPFDLHVILPHGAETDEVLALGQLTRDLAEKLRPQLAEAPQFPNVLRQVLCLRIDEDSFAGRLDLDWRVGCPLP